MNGSALIPPWETNEFLLNLQKLARFLRWLACSLLPDVYAKVATDSERTFPEASTFYYMWTAVEDQILTAWIDHVMQHPVSHLSLHYDGIHLSCEWPCSVEDFCVRCSEHIALETGYVVRIRQKQHLEAFAILATCGEVHDEAVSLDDVYFQPGNCIAAAIAQFINDPADLTNKLKDVNEASNVCALHRKVRTYQEVAQMAGVTLVPIHGFSIESPGR